MADDEVEWWWEVQEFYRTLYVVCSWLEDGCSGNCKQEEVEVVVVGYSTPTPPHYLQLVHYILGGRNRGVTSNNMIIIIIVILSFRINFFLSPQYSNSLRKFPSTSWGF